MAQNTGADSLIAPRAKVASAGVILALAIALVLGVSGCGGGSGASTQSTAGSSTSAQAPGAGDTGPSSAGTDSSSSSPGATAGSKPSLPGASGAEGPANPQSPGSGAGGKQGPQIKPPKGAPELAPTPAEEAQATVADIALASPELQSAEGAVASITPTYTCDGKDSSPGLAWRGIPQGTAELALFAMNSQPVGGKLFFDWAVAGIDPGLEGIDAGALPRGTVVGKNSFGKTGYEICPPKGSPETYIFALYALPKRLAASRGFDPHQLREAILNSSGNVGLMAAAYARQ